MDNQMRGYLAGLALVAGLVFAAPAVAQNNQVVVELYTSQGCSSCPPADELLRQLSERDGVIPLALHVDYWDYIGWKDIFGDPKFSARQKSYARFAGSRMVYTPQMIIGGSKVVVGSKGMEVVDYINEVAAIPSPVTLQISRSGDKVRVAAHSTQQEASPMIVQLVRYTPEETVRITRGENAGRTIVYANIVTSWEQIGKWNGVEPLELSVPAAGPDPVVVIVQARGPGAILAAARLR